MSISQTSVMSITKTLINTVNATEYFATPWIELSLLCFSMVAGFFVVRLICNASKSEGAPCSSAPCAEPSPLKQKLVGGRMGFQREPPPAQQASILLQQGKVKAAVTLLREMPETVAGCVPPSAARSILIAAMRTPKHDVTMSDLNPLTGKIPSEPLEALIVAAADKKEVADCQQLHAISQSLQIERSPATLEALAKAYSSDASSLRGLIEEAEAPLARCFAEKVLQACAVMKDFELASAVFEKVSDSDTTYLRTMIKNASVTSGDLSNKEESSTPRSTSAGSGGSNSTPSSPRSNSTGENHSQNSALGKEAGRASKECEDLDEGPTTSTSYHSLLDARVEAGDQRGAWRVVTDMQVDGVSPNATTCSILLKGKPDSIEEVSRVLVLVEAMKEPLDDVFFAALAEACIHVGRLDVLSKQIEKFQRQGLSRGLSAETYGLLIKAYGRAHDMKRVWALWKQMLSHQMAITSITIVCMVEALVANGLSKEAWRLVQELWNDETVQPLLDTVVHAAILKGFANARETTKVMALYNDMKVHKIPPNTLTFNTILNALAQCGTMEQVPALLEDMKVATPPVEPDIVTYSTLVKGFCNAGNVDRALQVYRNMRDEGECKPEEVMYNTLLGACGKELRPNDAVELLGDMMKSRIAPTNYALSMIVTLLGKSNLLDQAFKIVEDIREEYSLKMSIQVYTCLIQGCFHNGQSDKALGVYESIVRDGEALPDSTTYTVLVRGCLRMGLTDKAIELVRCAHGIGASAGRSPGLTPACLDEVVETLGGAANERSVALLAELPAVRSGPRHRR